MHLIRGQNNLTPLVKSVVTIGNFDGLHKGHQRLIKTLIDTARKLNVPAVLVTFEPNPKEFFSPDAPVSRLMRFTEKWTAVKQFGMDAIVCLRFDAKLAALSPNDFVKTILVEALGAQEVVVGDDFRFGAKRAGTIALLKALGEQYDFRVQALSQSMYQDVRISSARVRAAVESGDFDTVTALTGRPYTLTGRVAYGTQMGRKLGYPTANIYLRRKQVPLMGIFVVQVHGLNEKVLPGVASVGYRPTFGGKQILLEVHLFDFDQDIYGKRLTVEFLQKIRDEKYFDHVPDLVAEIDNDARIAREWHAITPPH